MVLLARGWRDRRWLFYALMLIAAVVAFVGIRHLGEAGSGAGAGAGSVAVAAAEAAPAAAPVHALFAMLVIMAVVTTVATSPILAALTRRRQPEVEGAKATPG